ncbi:hypothetical protein BVIR_2404 [Blastochloris viridis]|uniref:Uncharacterized protein n=1 Tax=Blastochloris viridis TaxID=1079 RepID=A0A0P0JDN4_BLAVI|nr:hypothetical protein BVIR_2404 [Blastochloris viridis]CUU42835.1 hypothetical protein BVIRIDIS_18500 [Blastochloris viridis]
MSAAKSEPGEGYFSLFGAGTPHPQGEREERAELINRKPYH